MHSPARITSKYTCFEVPENFLFSERSNPIALPGFEPGSQPPKGRILDRYTTGLTEN